jgi:tripartite ATP-independent transporter DctM subunit
MLIFMVTIAIITARDPEAGPAGERFPLVERLKSLRGILGFLILFIIVLGGIFGGLISPSEGGAVGAFGSFIILILRRRASLHNIITALRDTIKTTAMIFMIMIGATIFGYFLTVSTMPKALANAMVSMNVPGIFVLIIIIVIFIILGCFVDSLPLTIILVPIFWPVLLGMGWNGIWFGVMMVLCMQIGLITPPVGMCCYVMAGVAKDVPLQRIFRGAMPFLAALIVTLILVIIFPQLATFLPGLMKG